MFSQPKPVPDGVYLRTGHWPEDEQAIAKVRRAVFVVEQGVPEDMEWEPLDARCDWFVAEHAGQLVAVARLTPDRRIGRMAVLPEWRKQGIGSGLLTMALAGAVRRGFDDVSLHAQSHALAFYRRAGFLPTGPEFVEAGIPHRHMIKLLRKD